MRTFLLLKVFFRTTLPILDPYMRVPSMVSLSAGLSIVDLDLIIAKQQLLVYPIKEGISASAQRRTVLSFLSVQRLQILWHCLG